MWWWCYDLSPVHDEANKEFQRAHELSFGDNDVSLYRRLQKQGTTGPRWPRKLLSCNLLARSAKNPRYKGKIVYTKNCNGVTPCIAKQPL